MARKSWRSRERSGSGSASTGGERDAVDRACGNAQLAAGAPRRDHGVHELRGADDRVDRAAWMHLVQPMQVASSITATCGGRYAPLRGIERLRARAEQRAQAQPPRVAARRALVDVGAPAAIASAYGRQPS
jgi:hypothetical protein